MFDPYRKWLGIPDGKRPPDHYQLLGIAPDERDVDVIQAAALRYSAYVRNFQTGPHGDDATRILNEIASATICLKDPAKRAEYDATLKPNMAVLKPARKARSAKSSPIRWFVRTSDGRSIGPLDKASLDAKVVAGQVDASCQIWQVGWSQAKWAGELYEELIASASESLGLWIHDRFCRRHHSKRWAARLHDRFCPPRAAGCRPQVPCLNSGVAWQRPASWA